MGFSSLSVRRMDVSVQGKSHKQAAVAATSMPETMSVKTASTKDGSSRIVMMDLQGFGGKMLSLCCHVKTLYGKHLRKNFIPAE